MGLLASKNPPPADSRGEFSKRYDTKLQAIVYLAVKGLLDEGPDAFDELLKHINDHHYSHSYETLDGCYSASIADTCCDIILTQVYCFRDCSRLHKIARRQDTWKPGVNPDNLKE